MKKYIDAEAFVKTYGHGGNWNIEKIVNDFPAADVIPKDIAIDIIDLGVANYNNFDRYIEGVKKSIKNFKE